MHYEYFAVTKLSLDKPALIKLKIISPDKQTILDFEGYVSANGTKSAHTLSEEARAALNFFADYNVSPVGAIIKKTFIYDDDSVKSSDSFISESFAAETAGDKLTEYSVYHYEGDKRATDDSKLPNKESAEKLIEYLKTRHSCEYYIETPKEKCLKNVQTI